MKGKQVPTNPIADYALIGNLRCGALVAKTGTIDWFCPPKFDAPACFAALLGAPENGQWLLTPASAQFSVSRRYLPDTLILETTFSVASGEARVLDFMPVDSHCQIIRIVEGLSGSVDLVMKCVPRFEYGRQIPAVENRRTIVFNHEQGHLILDTDIALDVESDACATGRFTVEADKRHFFVLTFSHEDTTARTPPVDKELETCTRWWRDWASRNNYRGRWPEAVSRSLIALKALTYEPTGGMVAAPTTSLPEIPGAWANWDYRYCWIRDAALVLDIFLRRNYHEEAVAWRDWLRDAASHPDSIMHTVYAVGGQLPPEERELPWLSGYNGAAPVRVGNAARSQFQIDLRGELLDVFHLARRSGLDSDDAMWALQLQLLEHLETSWQKPDAGIWEFREEGLQLTHSKVLAWVAYDRSIKDAEAFGLDGPVDHWKSLREKIRADILMNGLHPEGGYFTQTYGSDETDASLLQIPEFGFLPADDPRMLATVKKIEEDLVMDGFVYRYKTDGYREGAFLPCTLWLANNYMLAGRRKDAETLFERVLSVCNDVGLLAEEYDPRSGYLLGNFPQSFTHLELINSAELIGAGEHVYRSGDE